VNILWGFESELQTNPMPFHLESLRGATLVPIRGSDVQGRSKIVSAKKNNLIQKQHQNKLV